MKILAPSSKKCTKLLIKKISLFAKNKAKINNSLQRISEMMFFK